jgi:hypothetical protein
MRYMSVAGVFIFLSERGITYAATNVVSSRQAFLSSAHTAGMRRAYRCAVNILQQFKAL